MPFSDSTWTASGPRPGSREIVVLLAGLMALNAFAIDAMIPALPAIGEDLSVAAENDRQLVVLTYFLGSASAKCLGAAGDRFGRKPVLALGVGLYTVFALRAESRRASTC